MNMTTTLQSYEQADSTALEAPDAGQPRAARLYTYCIIDALDGLGPGGAAADCFGETGVGGAEVFTIRHDGIAAVVSATAEEKLEITRQNAVAHQRVMEAAMRQGHTVLPVRFNTIADDVADKPARQRVINHVLIGRRQEILGLLLKMGPLVELGVKALWTDIEAVFKAIVNGDPKIQSLRSRVFGSSAVGAMGAEREGKGNVSGMARLGERVKDALEAEKSKAQSALLNRLTPLAVDYRVNKTFGDPMFANLALLVDKTRQDEVEAALSDFEAGQAGMARLRCVGPLPTCNFLELVITWDD